jgi:nitroreductase
MAPSGYNRQPWEFVVVTQRARIEQLASPVAQWMGQAGALIAVVMDPTSEYWLEDASAAIENMLIAATALGYGSCWVEGDALRREDDLKDFLNIPADRRMIALVPIGVPAEWPTAEKKLLEQVIHWESYGSRP